MKTIVILFTVFALAMPHDLVEVFYYIIFSPF